jgi:hypothetical protein
MRGDDVVAKFVKRPIVIEAEQWFPGKAVDGVIEGPYVSGDEQEYAARCPTLEGVFGVTPGDWIITGIKGEKYPCKPDIFEATYQPCEENEDMQKGRLAGKTYVDNLRAHLTRATDL